MPIVASCKFVVEIVEGDVAEEATVKMEARYDATQGIAEDVAFSNATPWGSMEFGLSNPNLAGFFEVGKYYYVDISPVDGEGGG